MLLSAAVIFTGIILAKMDSLKTKNNGQKIILGDLRRPDEKITVNRHMCFCCRMCRT